LTMDAVSILSDSISLSYASFSALMEGMVVMAILIFSWIVVVVIKWL
jgi:hypothetical protein